MSELSAEGKLSRQWITVDFHLVLLQSTSWTFVGMHILAQGIVG